MSVVAGNGGGELAAWQIALARTLSSPAEAALPRDVLGEIVPGGTLDAAGALAVYRNCYVARLSEQLGETYATVWRALGDDAFLAISASYIASHRSSSYNLSDYGRDFAAFLESAPETADAPFLPELARFELAFHDLFHSPADRGIDAGELAAAGDLSGVRLRFGSSVRLLAYERAVYDLFRHRNDSEAPDLEIDRPQWILLFKQGGEVLAKDLSRASFVALDALARGSAVDEALERADACDPEFSAASVQDLFETIALCGLVVGWER